MGTERRASVVARATQLVAGMVKRLSNVVSFSFASKVYTPAQITAAATLLETLQADVDTAKATLTAKLAAQKAQAPAATSLIDGFAAYVKLTFSESPDVLADFGLTPKKAATKLTTEQQLVAVAKRASTRVNRGTTSKKAKQAIKGDVVNVVTTPVKAVVQVVSTSAAPGTPANGGATGGTTPHGT